MRMKNPKKTVRKVKTSSAASGLASGAFVLSGFDSLPVSLPPAVEDALAALLAALVAWGISWLTGFLTPPSREDVVVE